MAKRKEEKKRIVLKDGTAITVKISDGLIIDDILINGMKAEGYRIMTGKEVFPEITRNIKDYLIKTGIIQD